jgi:hypothetical protein
MPELPRFGEMETADEDEEEHSTTSSVHAEIDTDDADALGGAWEDFEDKGDDD